MSAFLVFTLHAPLASWGDIAVGEVRGTDDRPSRSAILGLVAASLGIVREAQVEHDALDRGYGVAVRLDAPGTPRIDYHTAQTVAASAAKRSRAATRARLLASADPETILSRRSYRQDAVATVALWARAEAPHPPERLAAALRRPVFPLYAGRKANVLGLPLAPEVIEADSLAAALHRRESGRGMRPDAPPEARAALDGVWTRLRPRGGWGDEVSHDPPDGIATGLRPLRRDFRRDAGAHRTRWHFTERTVEVGVLPQPAREDWEAAP